MTETLTVLFGALVGVSLGLTGSGGAIFAVPLLVYGLGLPPGTAVGISLASVGVTALAGLLVRWRAGQVEVKLGLLFAAAGMLAAPPGVWLAGLLPQGALLGLLAVLMLVVAVGVWRNAATAADERPLLVGPACRRAGPGNVVLTVRCAWRLGGIGLGTGLLSGLFGVGGGFLIVPALVLFSGLSIQRAVGTSLLVVALVSGAGLVAQLLGGAALPLDTTAQFIAGSVLGMLLGHLAGRRVSGPALQRAFAVVLVAVAAFMLVRTLAAG